MRPPRAEFLRRARGWLVPAALLALAPKCVLCLLAYTGLAAALGLAGPELCGGAPGGTIPWAVVLPAAGALLAAAFFRRA
jgi:hypothetical protein